MEVGQTCRLDIGSWDGSASSTPDALFTATVTGVIIQARPHAEEEGRMLFYFHTTHVEQPMATRHPLRARHGALRAGAGHRTSAFSVASLALTSSTGYSYRFDGWYDELFLYTIDGDRVEPIPAEWLAAMEQATSSCELRLLSYALRPWFDSPFQALGYLALPEKNVCYSVSLCHRCLSPFFSQAQLTSHLEGYCGQRDPPGVLLYAEADGPGVELRYVDGAMHLHYCRCLSLLGKCFLESKVLGNDVDLYEFFVLTLPRAALPFVPGEAFTDESEFRQAACGYDSAGWSGRVVAGYFSRLKHSPHHTLSCIVTLPIFQQRRLGAFMLDVAYALTAERQRQCGCQRFCGSPADGGGSISKPFSPHGAALLLSYWREALLRMAWRRCRGGGDKAALQFGSLRDMAAAMDIPVAVEDLSFLLSHDNFAFYSVYDNEGTGPVAIGSRARQYRVSLVFDREKLDAHFSRGQGGDERETSGAAVPTRFRADCMRRRPDGALVYSKELFHY